MVLYICGQDQRFLHSTTIIRLKAGSVNRNLKFSNFEKWSFIYVVKISSTMSSLKAAKPSRDDFAKILLHGASNQANSSCGVDVSKDATVILSNRKGVQHS